MDLETIAKKVSSYKYHTSTEFLADIEQILANCILYNGRDSSFTEKAEALVRVCRQTLEEVRIWSQYTFVKDLYLHGLTP